MALKTLGKSKLLTRWWVAFPNVVTYYCLNVTTPACMGVGHCIVLSIVATHVDFTRKASSRPSLSVCLRVRVCVGPVSYALSSLLGEETHPGSSEYSG